MNNISQLNRLGIMYNVLFCLLFITLISGCGRSDVMGEVWEIDSKARAMEQKCDQRKETGDIKNWNDLTTCYYGAQYLYIQAKYPDLDFIKLRYQIYSDIHSKIESKEITPKSGTELKNFIHHDINELWQKRNHPQCLTHYTDMVGNIKETGCF